MKLLRTVMLLTVLTLIFCRPVFAQIVSHILYTDKNYDISGVVTLQNSPEKMEFLVVHDSKFPWQSRVSLVTVRNDTASAVHLFWPDGFSKLIDLESVSRCPDDSTFITMTSRGHGLLFRLSEDHHSLEGILEFNLPRGDFGRRQIEGFATARLGGTVYAFWSDRGHNDRPATVWWGLMDMATGAITIQDSVQISVPWPVKNTVRHISELRVDPTGGLWISAVRDGGNHGPFEGALYMAGNFRPENNSELAFASEKPPLCLLRVHGHKVEAFDFVHDFKNGVVLGTDDEKYGSILIQNW